MQEDQPMVLDGQVEWEKVLKKWEWPQGTEGTKHKAAVELIHRTVDSPFSLGVLSAGPDKVQQQHETLATFQQFLPSLIEEDWQRKLKARSEAILNAAYRQHEQEHIERLNARTALRLQHIKMIDAIRKNHNTLHEGIKQSTTRQKEVKEKATRVTGVVRKRTEKQKSLTEQVIEEGQQEGQRHKKRKL